MRYLVALGEDAEEGMKQNKAVLDVALKHATPGKDSLLLARVIEELKPDPAIILLDILCDDEEQLRLETEAKKKLEQYNQACVDAGVDCAFIVLVDDHPGNAICKAARTHKAECIVVGRRDLGTFQRLLTFSTSKYCIDNADCNVIVVKRPYSEEESPSKAEHEATQQIDAQGNVAPRVWTLRNPVEMQKSIERANATTASTQEIKIENEKKEDTKPTDEDKLDWDTSLEESKKDLQLVKKLEEEERQRRISEWEESRSSFLQNKTTRLESVKALEEVERSYRVQRDNEEEVREREHCRTKSREDRETARRLEDEEQARRISEDEKLHLLRLEESKRDLEIAKRLEELERSRRMKAMKIQQ